MALVYPNFSILPIGMSCQSAFQLKEQREFLDKKIGAQGRHVSTPFDWLIAPPSGVARMLESSKFFPDDPDDVTHIRGKVYYWRHMDIWFFHNDKLIERFDEYRSKFAYLASNLEKLDGSHVVGLWSNSQRNLSLDITVPPLDFIARKRQLDRLAQALAGRFPDAQMFHVIREGRMDADDPLDENTYAFYSDNLRPGNWQGHNRGWQRMMRKMINAPQIRACLPPPDQTTQAGA